MCERDPGKNAYQAVLSENQQEKDQIEAGKSDGTSEAIFPRENVPD